MKKSVIALIVIGVIVLIGMIGIVKKVVEERNVKKYVGYGEDSLVQKGENLDEEKGVIEDTSNVSQNSSIFSQ